MLISLNLKEPLLKAFIYYNIEEYILKTQSQANYDVTQYIQHNMVHTDMMSKLLKHYFHCSRQTYHTQQIHVNQMKKLVLPSISVKPRGRGF